MRDLGPPGGVDEPLLVARDNVDRDRLAMSRAAEEVGKRRVVIRALPLRNMIYSSRSAAGRFNGTLHLHTPGSNERCGR